MPRPGGHDLLTLKEAAEQLRLSPSTLKRYIYAGKVRSYRTPGGGHRLRRSDLAALMSLPGGEPGADGFSLARMTRESLDTRSQSRAAVARLERRVGRLEAEIERLEYSLDAMAAALRKAATTQLPSQEPTARECEIAVLGPGCRACDRLAKLVAEIADALGLHREAVQRVRGLDEIAEYGPTPLPALVINNELVSAGRLPTKSRLTELLGRCLKN